MKIEGFGIQLPSPLQPEKNKNVGTENFGNALTELIKTVNESQQESQKAIQDFVSGNGVELHEVMIAGEKAKTNLELLMEIRNKAIDMFKELTRTPV
ncbi:MAG: flagellar hook-basal body complex protein FliE [Melioribacteraceae bacterium]|nr:flagellar hook-basal body complex protein FliE [Melioribacteraceae bacterium]